MATAEDAARFIALESDDYDGMGGAKGYGWARASTEDVARGIHVGTEEAFRLLKAAKRKKLVTQVEGMRKTLGRETGRHREHEVGWALWEVHLDRAQTIERDGSARAPDERAMAFHKNEPALEDMARGEQVTGRDLLRAAAAVDLEVDSKLERLLDKPSIWVRPRLSNLTTDASNREAIELYGAVLAAKGADGGEPDDGYESNASSPLEWVKGSGVDGDGHSLTWWKNKIAKLKSNYDRPDGLYPGPRLRSRGAAVR